VVLRNGGPFGAHLAGTATVTLRVDRTPPVGVGGDVRSAGNGLLRADWTAEDATAGMARAAVQWRDGAHWRTVGEHAVGQGAGHMVVDVAALGVGERQLRVLATDAAGNSAAREGTTVLTAATTAPTAAGRDIANPAGGGTTIERPGAADRGAPAPSQAADPFARLRTARLSVGLAGARVTKRPDGRTVLVRALTVGGRVPMATRLVDRDGRPIAGAEVEARGRRGAVVGRGRTGADGRARLVLRPEAGAVLRVGVPAGGCCCRPAPGPTCGCGCARASRCAASAARCAPARGDVHGAHLSGAGAAQSHVPQERDPRMARPHPAGVAARGERPGAPRRHVQHPLAVRAARSAGADAGPGAGGDRLADDAGAVAAAYRGAAMSGPRAPWRTLAVALALVTPPVAGAAPVVTDPVLSPTSWSRGLSAGAVWEQTGFGTNHPGPASIEARAILSAHPWLSLSSLPGPLRDGTNGDLSIDVRHLEGEYAVRLVIAGLDPVALGTLRLDRTPAR